MFTSVQLEKNLSYFVEAAAYFVCDQIISFRNAYMAVVCAFLLLSLHFFPAVLYQDTMK